MMDNNVAEQLELIDMFSEALEECGIDDDTIAKIMLVVAVKVKDKNEVSE